MWTSCHDEQALAVSFGSDVRDENGQGTAFRSSPIKPAPPSRLAQTGRFGSPRLRDGGGKSGVGALR
ncbi:protein of unassigned function [Methylobacterium oryzae CBMB20]|uniref:Protein of unassigned function n=1 Tax=Methylobacterium oryzae CBMB20 TaxID=693986 RepID=A0A089P6V2_9HYPH|nr:protein of unassigned function [Methylobacterium oryzae CBMB20]